MDVPSTYVVHSFARPDGELDSDAVAEIASARRKAQVWESARVKDVHSFMLGRASTVAANAWYSPLSTEENLHWELYYGGRFDARRHAGEIPDEVTIFLEEAKEYDCFQSFEIRRCDEHFVLFGYVREVGTCVPIAGWYPEGSPLPDSDQLREYYETAEAEEKASKAVRLEERRARDAKFQEERRRTQMLARIHWGVALPLLLAAIVLFYVVVGWWAVVPAVLIFFAALAIRDEFQCTAFSPLRKLQWGLAILGVVSGVALGTTWLQFGTFTKDLTLCSRSLSDEYAYETPEGEKYTLTHASYNQLFDRLDYDSTGSFKVVADVDLNYFGGDPEVVSLRVVGDGYEACFK